MSSPCGCKTTGHEPDCWMLRQTNLVEPPSEATWRGLPQSRHEGFWFTVDSLAAALNKTVGTLGWQRFTPSAPAEEWLVNAAAIIQAAKEAERE